MKEGGGNNNFHRRLLAFYLSMLLYFGLNSEESRQNFNSHNSKSQHERRHEGIAITLALQANSSRVLARLFECYKLV
jgi:hypothetical protein